MRHCPSGRRVVGAAVPGLGAGSTRATPKGVNGSFDIGTFAGWTGAESRRAARAPSAAFSAAGGRRYGSKEGGLIQRRRAIPGVWSASNVRRNQKGGEE
jgi:hypothetical protein